MVFKYNFSPDSGRTFLKIFSSKKDKLSKTISELNAKFLNLTFCQCKRKRILRRKFYFF